MYFICEPIAVNVNFSENFSYTLALFLIYFQFIKNKIVTYNTVMRCFNAILFKIFQFFNNLQTGFTHK